MAKPPRVGRTPDILRKGGPMRDKTKYSRRSKTMSDDMFPSRLTIDREEYDRLKAIEEGGTCRFNCRTAREWFEAGWNMYADSGLLDRMADEREKAYQHERKRRQTKNT